MSMTSNTAAPLASIVPVSPAAGQSPLTELADPAMPAWLVRAGAACKPKPSPLREIARQVIASPVQIEDPRKCEVHGTDMIYSPARGDYACQDVTCRYGHGGG